MPINSKQKGARFERQLASRLREYGYPARRTAQYCGNTAGRQTLREAFKYAEEG